MTRSCELSRLPSIGARMRAFDPRTVGIGVLRSAWYRRSWARAIEWNVPAATLCDTPRFERRERNSPAAFRVKVSARIRPGDIAPVALCHAMRWVRTRVLPEPAPAWIARGRASDVTASRWDGSSPSSSESASWGSGGIGRRIPGLWDRGLVMGALVRRIRHRGTQRSMAKLGA